MSFSSVSKESKKQDRPRKFSSVIRIAIRMLLGDRVRFYALTIKLTVALLLLENLFAIFYSVLYSFTNLPAASEASIWVKDRLNTMYDNPSSLPNNALGSVRSTPGVAWAEPYYIMLMLL